MMTFANGNPNVVVDIGNTNIKAMADSLPPSRNGIVFPHARVEIDQAKYERLAFHYGDGPKRWQFIEWDSRFFIVGEDAFEAGDTRPLSGRRKYSRDYYGILFCASVLRLFDGDVPDQINVFAAHPPGDFSQTEYLQESIIGRWDVNCLGQRIRFKVGFASVFDEIVGGAMNVVLAPDGKHYADHPIVENGPTVVVDLGGGTFDIARLRRNGTVDYSQIASERIGINDAINTFKTLFDKEHRDLVADSRGGIRTALAQDIFMDPAHTLRYAGTGLDCTDLYERSINSLMNALSEAYREMAGGAINYQNALVTGGGGGLLFAEIAERLFPVFAANGVLHKADRLGDMHLANVRGGSKMLLPIIEQIKRREKKASRR